MLPLHVPHPQVFVQMYKIKSYMNVLGHWTVKHFCRLIPLNLQSANSLVFVLWAFTLMWPLFILQVVAALGNEWNFVNVSVFLAELLKMAPLEHIPLDINIKEPRWDQSTFIGRANHFFTVTDPRNILLSDASLENARKIVHDYRYERFYYWPQKSKSMISDIFKRKYLKHCIHCNISYSHFRAWNPFLFNQIC